MSSCEQLVDYVFGSMDEPEAACFEQQLFEDEASTEQVRELLTLLDVARRVYDAETTLSMTSSASAIAAFEASGKRVQRFEMRAGETISASAQPRADLLVGRLAIDLEGVERVDLELLDVDGSTRGLRADEVEVDRAQGCVWVPCAPHVAIASRATLFRLHAHRDDGSVTRHDYVGIVADD